MTVTVCFVHGFGRRPARSAPSRRHGRLATAAVLRAWEKSEAEQMALATQYVRPLYQRRIEAGSFGIGGGKSGWASKVRPISKISSISLRWGSVIHL